jgi:phosphoserine phosphatase RsbU/P
MNTVRAMTALIDPAAALRRDDLESILAITRRLAAPVGLHDLLVEVAAAACRVLQAERCSVWLLDAGRQELVLEVADDLAAIRLPVGRGLIGACARDLAVINVPDCYADPRFDRAMDLATGFHTRCSLTLPLVHLDGTLVGVIQVLNRAGGPFDAGDEALALALAAQAAVALQRARMTAALVEAEGLRAELQAARTVQMSTLPRELPDVPGYAMHATFRPASLTGGDTYDLARLANDQLLVVLGDASGHGIAPALSVTQMHAMLRMALRLGADLATAFREVNDQLAETMPDSRFVTAIIGLLDLSTHTLHYANGGQAPILHWHAADGHFTRLKPTSFPMGAMALPGPRPPARIVLAPGDLLVLSSDGIYEQEDAGGRPFGVERVEDLVRTHASGPVGGLAGAILQAFDGFDPSRPQDDDVTLVLLQRLPSA